MKGHTHTTKVASWSVGASSSHHSRRSQMPTCARQGVHRRRMRSLSLGLNSGCQCYKNARRVKIISDDRRKKTRSMTILFLVFQSILAIAMKNNENLHLRLVGWPTPGENQSGQRPPTQGLEPHTCSYTKT